MSVPFRIPCEMKEISKRFEGEAPENLIEWALSTYSPRIALATGFGPSGVVLMHMVSNIDPDTVVFYIETDLHFPETYALRDRISEVLGISFTVVRSKLGLQDQNVTYGTELWSSNPDECCRLRKVEPLQQFLLDYDSWITGIRRNQALTRKNSDLVEWDGMNHLVKINPLAYWSNDEIWSYLRKHELPYNVLHDRGYPSIGCMPCTRPVQEGEDQRAGRWAGKNKIECGIHARNGVTG